MINPKLKVDDRIALIQMPGESAVSYGDTGTVIKVNEAHSFIQYFINWDNGSTLALIEDLGDKSKTVDKWITEENFKKIVGRRKVQESKYIDMTNQMIDNRFVFQKFDTKFLFNYLEKLRQSGVVNMVGVNEKITPNQYLYLGSERIAHEHKYNKSKNDDAFEELVEMADQSKNKMIQGAIKVLETEGKEINVENVSRVIGQYSKKILIMWVTTYGLR